MKTYSVKQIAEMLNTNPETVRRWIRDNKLKAVQTSKKTGNVITEEDLDRFLSVTPRYLSKASIGLISPVAGMSLIAGGFLANALIGYVGRKNKVDVRIRPEDFKIYLQNEKKKLTEAITQKRQLISQTETEITKLSEQINQYEYLLEHEDLLSETLEKATTYSEV